MAKWLKSAEQEMQDLSPSRKDPWKGRDDKHPLFFANLTDGKILDSGHGV